MAGRRAPVPNPLLINLFASGVERPPPPPEDHRTLSLCVGVLIK
jgi:hypothetical protein